MCVGSLAASLRFRRYPLRDENGYEKDRERERGWYNLGQREKVFANLKTLKNATRIRNGCTKGVRW